MENLKTNNIIALIPARGGSQRVSGKNVRMLNGKPLISYTIEAALQVKGIDRVIVSTDCENIAEVALKYGAEVPFMRPSSISSADSTEYDFHVHAVNCLKENEGYDVDIIVNLYPTTPFRKAITIQNAIDKFLKIDNADSLRSIRKCKEHPYKMWVKQNDDYLERFLNVDDSSKQTLSYHLLPEVFIQNSSIYIVKKKTLDFYRNTIGDKVISFEMSSIESHDINYEEDFLFAEFMMKENKLD